MIPAFTRSCPAKQPCNVLMSALVVVAALAFDIGAPSAQDAETATTVFRDHVSGPLVQSRCIYCHVEGGRSSHTRLVFVRAAEAPDHEAFNLQAFEEFLGTVEGGHERILTKIQGAGHGGGQQVPVGTGDFAAMDDFLALLDGRPQGFVARLLEALDEGETSLLFAITTPADADSMAGSAVAVSATGAPTEAVHFAYRPDGDAEGGFMYLGAAANREAALYVWDSAAVMDGDYELAALFTEDEGTSVIYDAIEVTVDNVAPAVLPDIVEDRGRKTQALRMDATYEVITAGGVVVTLPAGALAGDDRITIAAAGPPDPDTAPGDAVGTGIDIALASGRDTFGEAITVAIPYPEGKPDGIVHETGIPEAGLSLWFFDPQADAWALVAGSMVRPDADVVVAEVEHTGEFGIFSAPLLRVERHGEPVTALDFGAGARVLRFTVVNGNAASGPLTWTVDPPHEAWLAIEPDRGNSRSEAGAMITVSVDRTGLEPGDYADTLHVRSNGGVREVSFTMRVATAPGGNGGGCAMLPVHPGGPLDPTLMGLVALVTTYLIVGRRRLKREAVMG